jgi:hypothetical protein
MACYRDNFTFFLPLYLGFHCSDFVIFWYNDNCDTMTWLWRRSSVRTVESCFSTELVSRLDLRGKFKMNVKFVRASIEKRTYVLQILFLWRCIYKLFTYKFIWGRSKLFRLFIASFFLSTVAELLSKWGHWEHLQCRISAYILTPNLVLICSVVSLKTYTDRHDILFMLSLHKHNP